MAEGKCGVAHVRVGEALHELTRTRTLYVKLSVRATHVRHRDVAVRWHVSFDMRLDVTMHGVGGDHVEAIVAQLAHCQVGLQRAVLVQPLSVGDRLIGTVDVGSRQAVEAPGGVVALHKKFAHERHVDERDAFATRTMLVAPIVEEVVVAQLCAMISS